MTSERDGISPAAEPSGTGCVECLALGGWWFHLRRCAECGHNPAAAIAHQISMHRNIHRRYGSPDNHPGFEPGERWFYDYRTGQFVTGPQLCGAASTAHPFGTGSIGARTGGSGAFKMANAAFHSMGCLPETHSFGAMKLEFAAAPFAASPCCPFNRDRTETQRGIRP